VRVFYNQSKANCGELLAQTATVLINFFWYYLHKKPASFMELILSGFAAVQTGHLLVA